MISRHPATSLRPCRPVPDLVSTRLPTLSKTDRLWVGLLGHLGGARVQMSRQALGGARPLISQAVQGRESLWRDPLPQAGAAQDRDKKAFLDPHPRQAGRGPGGPGRGGSATALTGPRREDVLGDVGGLGSPLADSHRPNEPAAPLPPSAASCTRLARGGGARTPGRAAGTGQKPRPGGGGRRAPVGGTTSEPPGSGRKRPRLGVRGRGQGRHPLSQSCPLLCVTWTVQQPAPARRVHLHVVSM